MPFHLLVAGQPDDAAADPFRAARWLARDHAITVLPSVSAIAAIGRRAPGDTARDAYLGFADPLLTGRSGQDRRAFDRQTCDAAPYPAAAVAAADMPAVAT